MDTIILPLVVAVIGSSGVASIVVALLNRYWQKSDKEDERIEALVTAQKTIMIDRVKWLGRGYLKQGAIDFDDKENLLAMHSAYKALGGDGVLDPIMAEISKLPVRG